MIDTLSQTSSREIVPSGHKIREQNIVNSRYRTQTDKSVIRNETPNATNDFTRNFVF